MNPDHPEHEGGSGPQDDEAVSLSWGSLRYVTMLCVDPIGNGTMCIPPGTPSPNIAWHPPTYHQVTLGASSYDMNVFVDLCKEQKC